MPKKVDDKSSKLVRSLLLVGACLVLTACVFLEMGRQFAESSIGLRYVAVQVALLLFATCLAVVSTRR